MVPRKGSLRHLFFLECKIIIDLMDPKRSDGRIDGSGDDEHYNYVLVFDEIYRVIHMQFYKQVTNQQVIVYDKQIIHLKMVNYQKQ
jgi:hypothetical protein